MRQTGTASQNSWEDHPIPDLEALAELERVLADPEFQSTERNKKFLRFVVEEFFRGHESSVKAYSIAVDVFGRPSSFDPATDPIVRIEATRLRASLTRYYELHGRDGGVRIDLPKGRYLPTFSRLKAAAKAELEGSAADVESRHDHPPIREPERASRLWPSQRAKWMAVSFGVFAAVCAGGFLMFDGFGPSAPPLLSEKPGVAIRMRLAGGGVDGDALAMRDRLMVALARFQTLRVASSELPRNETTDDIQTSSAFRTRQNSYHVILKYSADRDARSVWWQVVDAANGEALNSGTERVLLNGSSMSDPDEALVRQLATRFASGRGVINSVETAREMASPTIGSGCVLRAALAIEAPDAKAFASARGCLEQTLALRPGDPDASAALAAVLLGIDPVETPTTLSEEALQLANRSVAMAPYSDRSAAVQMAALFRAGQIEPAIAAGRRATALNPDNPVIAARFGRMLFTVGR